MKGVVRSLTIVFFMFAFMGAPLASAQMSFFEFLHNQQIGKAAPDFTLKNLKGEDTNMTKMRDGKNAIIFFWATWCPHCRVALKGLNRDHLEIEQKGIRIILVDVGEESEEVITHARNNQLAMDVLLDSDNSVSEKYGVVGVPTFIFVSQDGKIRGVEHSLPRDYEKLFAAPKKK